MNIDTGSADLWVYSDLMDADQRGNHPLYKTHPSKKLANVSWQIGYLSGASRGAVYIDNVTIGPITAQKQAVEAASFVSSTLRQSSNLDGILGLGFHQASGIDQTKYRAKSWFENVKSSLAQPVFAANLKKGRPGYFDFGYIDHSKFKDELAYTAVDNSKGDWTITVDGFAIGDDLSTSSYKITGDIDTGSTLMALPKDIADFYYSKVDGAVYDERRFGGYVFPCDATLPDFSVFISRQKRTVPGSFLNHKTTNTKGVCFGGIQTLPGFPLAIFGDIFLKSQYVVFDMTEDAAPRIGFGQQ